MRSGLICQPSGHTTGGGASFASPSGEPPSAHFAMVSISLGFSEWSFKKCPTCGSANHGGIFRRATAAFIALAQGRTSLYVKKDIGATSPGRWQVWQFFCKIGRMSLLKVADGESAATSVPAQISAASNALLDMRPPGCVQADNQYLFHPADSSNRFFLSPIGPPYRA